MTAEQSRDSAEAKFMAEWNAFMAQEEPQWFLQILNLDADTQPRVWLRYFGADFMAECDALRPGNKRRKLITATGPTIEECLNNLASNVAGYLYPPGAAK